MTGGKTNSSSSSNTTSTTDTTSATSTGTVGQVLQGQDITINQNLPDAAVEVFKQLIELSGNAIEIAAAAGEKALDTTAAASQKALDSTNQLAQTTKQPDVTLIQGYQKQVYYAIAGASIVTLLIIFRSKK